MYDVKSFDPTSVSDKIILLEGVKNDILPLQWAMKKIFRYILIAILFGFIFYNWNNKRDLSFEQAGTDFTQSYCRLPLFRTR